MKMKLGEIYQAMNAWRALAAVKMQPQMAYKVLKYVKLVSAEYEIADKQRVELIHEITGTQPGQDAKIEPGSQEFVEYAERLNDILSSESDLDVFGGSLDDVMAVVRDSEDNLLSVSDLATLEGFFKEPCVPEPPAVAGKVGPCSECCDCCDTQEPEFPPST